MALIVGTALELPPLAAGSTTPTLGVRSSRAKRSMRLGIDTGGTFTDCVAIVGGIVRVAKVFSTPGDPGRGILEGMQALSRAGGRIRTGPLEIIHGTTVGTNTLLERSGARVALVTSAGFEDLIEIGRQNRPKLYDLCGRRDPPLVPRALRWGIAERTVAGGRILKRPELGAVRRLARAIERARAESLAICFLFSFANPENERCVARVLGRLRLPISVSSEILPEFREYERLSTVVVNAYLAPRLGSYFEGLRKWFEMPARPRDGAGGLSKGLRGSVPYGTRRGKLFVMQSSGGITAAGRAAREPVRTILSGPAGGVVAARKLGELVGVEKAISFDMGGTSTDVCLLPAATTRETLVAGVPVAVPVLDIHTVGAGGGSVARMDAGGALRVGPESAGASPGPACYGRGGTRPTTTDAHLILGRLDPDFFLGGQFRLDRKAAEQTFAYFMTHSRDSGSGARFKDSFELARGIIKVSNATMERALRVISVERGHDPRDFSLICFGGAGGLHAADLARGLGLRGVIVPRQPGAFSALGILCSDIIRDVSESLLVRVPERPAAQFAAFFSALVRRFERLEARARRELAADGFHAASAISERRLEIRYVGQSYELSVPFTPNFERRFQAEHERAHGYFHVGRAIEIVNLRARLAIPVAQPAMRRAALKPAKRTPPKPLRVKPVWFESGVLPTLFFERDSLPAGVMVKGPAVVVEYSATTVVPPDFTCHVDRYLNLRLECAVEH